MTVTDRIDAAARRHPAVLIGVLCGVQFLAVVDSLAVALALPAIGRDLALGPTGLSWVMNAMSLSLAGGLLLAGRLCDVYGRRPMFVVGLVLMTVGAAVAGGATGPAMLLTGRVLQGLGAATAYPSALALLGDSFPDEPWRSRAFAGVSVSGASATATGVVFGGLATAWLGWPWVFWLTAPAGLLLLAVGALVLPAPGPRRSRSLDLPGAALAIAAVVTVVATVVHTGETHRLGLATLFGAGAAVVLLVALMAWERVAAEPLLPGHVLRSSRLRGGSASMAASSAVYSAIAFTVALQLHDQVGLSPAEAGAALLPLAAGIVLTGTLLAPRLRRRFGSVRLALGGLVLGVAGMCWLAAAPPSPSYVGQLLPPLLLVGAGLSGASTGAMEHALGSSETENGGVASGAFETSTHVGGAVSVSCYASVLAIAPGSYPLAHLLAAGFGLLGAAALVVTCSSRPTGRPRRSRPRCPAGRGRSAPAGAAAAGTSARASTRRRPPR